MRKIKIIAVAVVFLLAACGKKEESAAPAENAPTQEAPKSGVPDFGGVTKVSREVEAVGSTQELAVLAALQSAVSQVNGVRIASQMQSVRAGLDLSVNGQSAGSTRSEAFARKMISASQGAVTGFEILSQEEIDKVDEEAIAKVRASDGGYSYSASASSERKANVDARRSTSINVGGDSAKSSGSYSGSASSKDEANVDIKRGASSYESDSTYKKMRSYWKVRVRVDVAKYKAADEGGRPKIVVAMPKTLTSGYAVGDGKEDALEIARAIRGRLSEALTQTKRFIVLDREFGNDIQAEIDRINSGNVRVEDSARIGQQLATDLILIPTIERFEYLKSVRKLKMSDRELVSYSGGGRITLRLLNATTGEVVMSDSFEYKLASADPSTMPRVIDGKNMAAEMMSSLSGQIGSAIVNEIFPISVVALNGDQVVLSQGGESVQVGQRWQAVHLGEELKDPQTGRSLGRNETPFGTIRIDRVSTQTSYGTVEEGTVNLGHQSFKPGAIELRKILATASKVESKEALKQTNVTTSSEGTAKPASKTKHLGGDTSKVQPDKPGEDKW